MKKSILFCVLFANFTLNIINLNADELFSISLEGRYRIFIEIGSYGNDCLSAYAFILPSESDPIKKSIHPCNNRANTTILENINPNLDLDTRRYQLDKGFVFFRSSKDTIYCSDASDMKVTENIVFLLNNESNCHSVYFYDYENKISYINALEVSCEGKIFSPKKTKNNGFFFFRKLKPPYYSGQNCYLIYYDFTSEYDAAKFEFQRLCSYIYLIPNDGAQ
ncbi:MAG: hypothetical protein H0T62_13405 [Parachlamydiaceae bacterium]|nr:hypothetical protein [Parachlamydiaceae bacterium]